MKNLILVTLVLLIGAQSSGVWACSVNQNGTYSNPGAPSPDNGRSPYFKPSDMTDKAEAIQDLLSDLGLTDAQIANLCKEDNCTAPAKCVPTGISAVTFPLYDGGFGSNLNLDLITDIMTGKKRYIYRYRIRTIPNPDPDGADARADAPPGFQLYATSCACVNCNTP